MRRASPQRHSQHGDQRVIIRHMPYESIVGLHVTNDKMYTQYREAMIPILIEHGGGFRYDFIVSDVLQNEEGNPINRVFVIYFKDKSSMESFFSNEAYLKIREQFFEKSVGAISMISQYER